MVLQHKANKKTWDTLLSSNNIEDNWATFKLNYNNSYFVTEFIPDKLLKPGKQYKVPWLNDHRLKKVKAKITAHVNYCESPAS